MAHDWGMLDTLERKIKPSGKALGAEIVGVDLAAPLTGDMLTMADIAAAETRLLALSDAIGQRYFLQLRKTQSADILA